jgi:conjugal transfer/entry exclusion protein
LYGRLTQTEIQASQLADCFRSQHEAALNGLRGLSDATEAVREQVDGNSCVQHLFGRIEEFGARLTPVLARRRNG